jgi:hypothetical protein
LQLVLQLHRVGKRNFGASDSRRPIAREFGSAHLRRRWVKVGPEIAARDAGQPLDFARRA